MSKIIEAIKSIVGETRLPKSFRKTLEDYKDATISNIEVVREPLSKLTEGVLSLVTAGKWGEIRKNYDKIFHLYAVLHTSKGRLHLEKNQTPVLWPKIPVKGPEAETMNVPGGGVTVGEFIEKAIKRMGLQTYVHYDGLKNNCQNFIQSHLLANALLTPAAISFIKQDTKKIIEQTPSLSKWLMEKITDIAGAADTAVQELVYKKGGTVRHFGIGRKKRFV